MIPFFVVKLVIYPGFSNAVCETLRIYTFLVMVFIVGEIRSIMLKVWKIKSRNAILVAVNNHHVLSQFLWPQV